MLLDQIHRWAQLQPNKPAIIDGDRATSYVEFAKRIALARTYLDAQRLPVGSFAIVLTAGGAKQWSIALALRALGLHTVCAPSLDLAAFLKVGNVSCIVVDGDPGLLGRIPGTLA